jgi:RND family efflux transporter MFP subunit
MIWKRLAVLIVVLSGLGLAGYGGLSVYRDITAKPEERIPVAPVRRGDVAFTITAQGQLQGGNSRMMTAPMTGSSQLVLTQLSRPGELVKQGDVVAQFDTTEETYKLREAEADLAEAKQQVIQATNEALAREEELNYELLSARSDLKQAELEALRNPLVAAITARQNDLAVEAARDRLAKLERDYPQRKAAAKASIAIQEAAEKKAQVQAETAKRNIDMMTLKAPVDGYLNVERNTDGNFFFRGMEFPLFQVGDQVRAGVGVAQIPDTSSYEATAQINEQDRGHLATGLEADLRIVALQGKQLRGKVIDLGTTTGPPWNRRFEAKLKVLDPSPDLRPGMSARLVIRTDTLRDTLWIPAQALFESDGRKFVYLQQGAGFSARDVKLVRKGESQVVIEGVKEGERVALASPDQRQQTARKGGASSASKAIAK